MRKLFLTVLSAALLLLAACSSNDLPPSPPSPGGDMIGRAVASASGMPVWAVEARNVAVTPSAPYYNDGVVIAVSNFDYVYKNAYFFNSKLRIWEKISFEGELAGDWLKQQAVGSLTIDSSRFETGENYIVFYACSKTSGKWDCSNNKWQLAGFKVLGSPTGNAPEAANAVKFVVYKDVPPFKLGATGAEADNFLDINVIRYDARYAGPKDLAVLVHVFDFNSREEVEKTIYNPELFKQIVIKGWKQYQGHNLALFLDDKDHRTAVWTSGKVIVYVETFQKESASKEVIEAYLEKYPSDLKKPV